MDISEKLDALDMRSDCRFVQFQLWRNCNCNCDFCYNKGLPRTDKIWSMNEISKKLKDPIIKHFNEIGLIGGEIFGKELEDEAVRNRFYLLLDEIIDLICSGQVRKVYITSALLYKDTTTLTDFIEHITEKGVVDNFLLCTSYDTKYRFKNENSKELWERNVFMLHEKYPRMKIHTETILSQDFISKVLSGEFDILGFQEKYKTKLNFIEPQCNSNCNTKAEFDRELPDFLPKRRDFIKFLRKCYKEQSINFDEFLNESLHSDLLYLECKGYLYEFLGRRRFPTLMDVYYREIGRNFFHLGYADSDIKMEDDVKNFKEMFL